MLKRIALGFISRFERRYQYDAQYLRQLLKQSPKGFWKFNKFMAMSSHRETLPADAYFVASLTACREEDCGSCLHLMARRAFESGVPREIVESAANGRDDLPGALTIVRNYAHNVANRRTIDPELIEVLEEMYGPSAVAEFALAIASTRVFPTVKRSMGFANGCPLGPISL